MPARSDKQSAGQRKATYAIQQRQARRAAEKAAARAAARKRAGITVEAERHTEIKLLTYLFVVSAVTMLLVMMYFAGAVLKVTMPYAIGLSWVVLILVGAAFSWLYGTFLTARYRHWGWFVFAVIPLTAVPGMLAFTWNRRQEIERETAAR